MSQIRLALIGVGAMGRVHAKRLMAGGAPSIRLVALCDPNPSIARDFPSIPCYTSLDDLFNAGGIDAVFVATPHFFHAEAGIAALERGLHVMVEKPMAANKGDALRLVEAMNRSGLVVSVMLSMRTKPFYRKAKELIDSGELGSILRVNWTATEWFRTQAYFSSSEWRGTWKGEGGGVLLNQCPHQLDIWYWLFGQPESVTAFCNFGRYHAIETEDDVTAVLHYPDGMNGVFIASTGEAPGTDRLEIVGEMGRLIVANGKVHFDRNRESMTRFCRESPTLMDRPEMWSIDVPLAPQTETGHLTILENFAGAILRGEQLIAPAADGVCSVELVNAMQLSTWTRSTIVLPLDAKVFNDGFHKVTAAAALNPPHLLALD